MLYDFKLIMNPKSSSCCGSFFSAIWLVILHSLPSGSKVSLCHFRFLNSESLFETAKHTSQQDLVAESFEASSPRTTYLGNKTPWGILFPSNLGTITIQF